MHLQITNSSPCGSRLKGRPNVKVGRLLAPAPLASADVESGATLGPRGSGRCPILSQLPSPPPPVLSPLADFLLYRLSPKKQRIESQANRTVTHARFLGTWPAVMVNCPVALKEVTAYEAQGTVRVAWPPSVDVLMGEESVLVVSEPAKHKMLRKLIAGAMSADAVERYVPAVQNICEETLELWADEHQAGRTVLALPELKKMAMHVVTSVVLDWHMTEDEVAEVYKDFKIWVPSVLDVFPFDVWPLPFYHASRARERIVARIEQQIAKVDQTSDVTSHSSLLKMLVAAQDEHGNKLSHKQLVDNILTLLFGGYETTAIHMCTCVFFLAKHPEVLARLHAEQQQIISRHGARMTPVALREMKYLHAVLAESFRMQPVVGMVGRRAEQDVAIGGYKIDAQQDIMLHYGMMMQKDSRWPAEGDPATNPLHPANFNPDRFMTEEGHKQGGQFPFGTGQRTCAGMALAQAESRAFLAALARGYTVSADTNTEWIEWPNIAPANSLPTRITRLRNDQ